MIHFQTCLYSKRVVKPIKNILSAFILLGFTLMEPSAANDYDENSIPEPTQLSVAVADVSTELRVIQSQKLIISSDSSAEISLIKARVSGTTEHLGIQVSLKDDDIKNYLYIDANQATQLREEFAELNYWFQRKDICDARRCVQGVARCRPSQAIRQAFCPGFYSASNGERGIVLSTKHHSFYFPSIEPTEILGIMDTAISELARLSLLGNIGEVK